MPTVRPGDYKSANYVLTQQGAFLREFSEFNPGLLEVGKSLDLLRGNLGRLTQEVRQADQIFSNAARRGDAFGLLAFTHWPPPVRAE